VATARTHYESFLSQWKNADPDIPLLPGSEAGIRASEMRPLTLVTLDVNDFKARRAPALIDTRASILRPKTAASVRHRLGGCVRTPEDGATCYAASRDLFGPELVDRGVVLWASGSREGTAGNIGVARGSSGWDEEISNE
jgi:hypothetical protein